MKMHHPITIAEQPTQVSCGQTALAMLLSYFDDRIAPEELMKDIPMLKTDDGKDWGTVIPDLAHWCMRRGYQATLHTFDSQLVHQTWAQLETDAIIHELKTLRDTFVFPTIGTHISRTFIDAYVRYLSDGGILIIAPCITLSLIHTLLTNGPFIATVSYANLYTAKGGTTATHFVVVYGSDANGNILIADPWKDNGFQTVDPERLIGAVMAAQMTCENAVFQIQK